MPHISSVSFEHFRGIESGSLDGLGDVTILIGRNNSGKTTVLEGLSRLSTAYGDNGGVNNVLERHELSDWVTARGEAAGLPAELWYRRDRSRRYVVTARLGDARLELIPGGVEPGLAPADDRVQLLGRHLILRPALTGDRSIEKKLWREILATRRDKLLVSELHDVFHMDVEQIQLPPDGVLTLLFATHALPLDSQGDAIRAAMRSLLILSAATDTWVGIEEPECHRHPGALEREAVAVVNIAKSNRLQLVITSHSLEAVGDFLTASRKAGVSAVVFHLSLENGLLDARRIDPDTFDSLKESGLDPRFIDRYA